MITNEKQYRAARQHAESFRMAVEQFDEKAALARGIDPLIVRAQLDALKGQHSELLHDIEQYELLRDGKSRRLEALGFSGIAEALIRARIAQGLSQRELAERLGLREQQIQRYEAERYAGASLERLTQIEAALGIGVKIDVDLRKGGRETKKESDYTVLTAKLDKAAKKEITKRNWIEDDPSAVEADAAFIQFFKAGFHNRPVHALHRKSLGRRGESTNFAALVAWQSRVMQRARDDGALRRRPTTLWSDPVWLSSLARLSIEPNGPLLAREFLKDVGISLVIEKHLAHTSLDGAAMILDGVAPLIALTLRWDRLDNFWFVLMHEIGHLMLHRKRVLEDCFLDELLEEAAGSDVTEQEADDFARTALIPDEAWNTSMARLVKTDQEVIALARSFKVSPAIVAGRLRRERQNYEIFTKLVGQGQVRKLFEGREPA